MSSLTRNMENEQDIGKVSDKVYYLILAAIVFLAALIRLWQLNKIPAGLYWDEMDAGFQASSFLHTGRDYFGNLFPIHFHSLADHRTPLIIWSMVPFVALLGLTESAVRLPVVIWGLVSIVLFYFVAQQFLIPKRWALLACTLMAFAPWHVQYSRMGFEAISELTPFFLGIIFFFKSLKNPRFFPISAAAFAFTLYAYATASLFIPLFGLAICFVFRREILAFPRKQIILAVVAVIAIAGPIMGDSVFNGGAQRFSQLLIFNEPTFSGQVDYLRREASLSRNGTDKLGVAPTFFDKLAINKPLLMSLTVANNYLMSLSNDFLFITGDPNLRQSPSEVGELYRIGAVGLPLGIVYLVLKRKKYGKHALVLAAWVFMAPIPSVITIDGGNHATRLLFLFPALHLVTLFGIKMLSRLLSKTWRRPALIMYMVIWIFEAFLFLHFYFANYYFESAHVFQYGFKRTSQLAKAQAPQFDKVIIDAHHDSAFMAYIFANKVNPKTVQAMAPFHYVKLPAELEAFQIQNIYFLPPGERDWPNIVKKNLLPGHNLYIIASDEISDRLDILGQFLSPIETTIRYPDTQPVFYVYEQQQ